MADQEFHAVSVPERDIPPPPTISEVARNALSEGAIFPGFPWPAWNDVEGWRAFQANTDPAREAMFQKMLDASSAEVREVRHNGVLCYDCLPAEGGEAVYLFIHGGAFVVGGGLFAKAQGARAADTMKARCVSVDYRMPPDHPYPAPVEDCVAVYRALLDEGISPAKIVIGGASAGGNLAAAATLMIRDRGLPMPAGIVLLTPEVDLTESGDTFRTNEMLDVVLKRGLPDCNRLYANGADLADPYLSPLFADFAKGFPPAFIQSGTRDLFLSNSVLMHRKLRKAGIEADLHVWEAMPHGAFVPGEAPENAEVQAEVAQFIARITA